MVLRPRRWQQFHGLRVGGFQKVTIALAPCTIDLNIGHKSRIEGGSSSNYGSRLRAAHMCLTASTTLQDLNDLRTVPFENVALA
eukprot:4377722-Pyramimonas_sp.AAC.1